MPKRLIICCDGTWNRPDQLSNRSPAPTNVSKLALGIAPRDRAGNEQLLHYQPGVGTRRFERIRGGALGLGLSRNVRECYRFLVGSYEPGDELYLFGFSRGAFTARSVAGLVRNSGILRPEHADRIKDAYRLYRARSHDKRPRGIEARIFRRMYSHPDAPIHFIGVWDTVGSLGIPIDGVRVPWITRRWSFHDTTLSSHVRYAFHALAIDEQRGPFRPTLWEQQPDADGQVLEQVWFSGVHCDVGGGYGETELSEIPLLWMAGRAASCGLEFAPDHFRMRHAAFDPARRQLGADVAPDPLGPIHESRTGFYRLLPRMQRRLEADGGAVASSATVRHRETPGYEPPNLAAYIAAGGATATVTTASAATPSSRPTNPMPSPVDALTLTHSTGSPSADASEARIASR